MAYAEAMASALRLFAHQGGWDEILLVVAPLGFIALMLWLANRRLSAQLEAAQLDGEQPDRCPDDDAVVSNNSSSPHGNSELTDGNVGTDQAAKRRERP